MCVTHLRPLDPKTAELVVAYYPLVQRIARRLTARLPPGIEVDDLVSAGVIGLIEALARFDPARGVPFEVSARYRIQGAMLDALRATDWVPRAVRLRGKVLEHARRTLIARLGRAPSPVELAEHLETTVEVVHALLVDADARQPISFETAGSADGDAPCDRATDGEDPERRCVAEQLRRSTFEATSALPPRERLAIDLFYFQDRPLKEIAAILQVTDSRVSQLCRQGIDRLRGLLDPPPDPTDDK